MNKQEHTTRFLKRRKFYTVLPVLALPFLTLIFWSLGGGAKDADSATGSGKAGLNTELPDAYLKDDKAQDKMSYYDKAANDSLKLRELMKADPNYRDSGTLNSNLGSSIPLSDSLAASYHAGAPSASLHQDGNEEKVYRKLAQLNAALNPSPEPKAFQEYPVGDQPAQTGVKSADIDRLEQMMQSMNQQGDDPEMTQLNGMLEKILDIQNPARAREKLRQTSEQKRGQVFAVETGKKPDPVSTLDNGTNAFDRVVSNQSLISGNGFYSFDQLSPGADSQNAIQAVVHETQTLVNGSTVKLRLVNDIFINGVLIPHDQFIYGIAALNGERLSIKISSIRYRNSLYPVELSVYDMDGLDGIYIPGAISRDVAKTSTEQGMQNIGLTTLDPSIGMQAASFGIEAAKGFLSKKVKLVRVSVKAGYRVLLHDEKQKQQN